MFRGSVKGIDYPLHSPVSPSLPLPCVTVCHHISTGSYYSGISLERWEETMRTQSKDSTCPSPDSSRLSLLSLRDMQLELRSVRRSRIVNGHSCGIACSKRDGTRAETRFGISAKRTSPFKSAGASVQSTTGSRRVRISGQQLYRPCSDIQCKTAGYALHSHLFPSLPLPCVTVCHQVLNALYCGLRIFFFSVSCRQFFLTAGKEICVTLNIL